MASANPFNENITSDAPQVEAPVNGDQVETAKVADESKKSTKRLTGTVKWFNVKEGFGFITRHDTGEDVFVHKSCILKPNKSHRVKSIGDGEVVEFGLIASKVTAPGFKQVKGSPFVATLRNGKGRPKSSGSEAGRRPNSKREDGKKKEDTIGDGLNMQKISEMTLKEKENNELGDAIEGATDDASNEEAASTSSTSTASTTESVK